jgi:hypothetical protein
MRVYLRGRFPPTTGHTIWLEALILALGELSTTAGLFESSRRFALQRDHL